MAINWRPLLDSIGIPWTDRSPNSISRSPVINCPFCQGTDPSEHLNLFAHGGYRCMRNAEHKGGNPFTVLRVLLPYSSPAEILEVLSDFETPDITPYVPQVKSVSQIQRMWNSFLPAAKNRHYTDYLFWRGFPDPIDTCQRYDLRYAPNGEWAARLLFPVVIDGQLVNWTGRDIRANPTLRYRTQSSEQSDLVYMPRAMRADAIIVEGPVDALKVAVAAEHMPISPIALMTTAFNEDKIWLVIRLLKNCHNIWTSFDPEVAPAYPTGPSLQPIALTNSPYRELNFWLATALKVGIVRRLRLPRGWEDLGAMDTSALAALLANPERGGNEQSYDPGQLTTYEQASRATREYQIKRASRK
jgi:hypothetical protein